MNRRSVSPLSLASLTLLFVLCAVRCSRAPAPATIPTMAPGTCIVWGFFNPELRGIELKDGSPNEYRERPQKLRGWAESMAWQPHARGYSLRFEGTDSTVYYATIDQSIDDDTWKTGTTPYREFFLLLPPGEYDLWFSRPYTESAARVRRHLTFPSANAVYYLGDFSILNISEDLDGTQLTLTNDVQASILRDPQDPPMHLGDNLLCVDRYYLRRAALLQSHSDLADILADSACLCRSLSGR